MEISTLLSSKTRVELQKNNYYNIKFQRHIGKSESFSKDIKKNLWLLPLWSYQKNITKRLSYHNNDNKKIKARNNKDENYFYLRSISPGQEFILDLPLYPECPKQWILDIRKKSKCS